MIEDHLPRYSAAILKFFTRRTVIVLTVLIVLGTFLRLTGLNHGVSYHPDERHMVMVTEKMDPRVTLNPESFAYGSLPYYLTRFTAEVVRLVWEPAIRYDGLFIVGRLICILFGVLAIPLTYWIGARTYRDPSVGYIAAAFVTVSVLHVQLSRFFTADIMLTTLALGALCSMVMLAETGKIRWYIISAVCCGLSVGTKLSGLFLAFPFAVAIVLDAIRYRRQHLLLVPAFIVMSLAIAAVTFLAVEPYSVLDYATFMRQNREQTHMARGLWRPPYTIQYENTAPYFYHLKQMLLYTMGIPLALSVFAGCIYALGRQIFFVGGTAVGYATKAPRATVTAFLNVVTYAPGSELILLAWVLSLFGVTGGFMVKYPRYLLPLYPVFFVFAALVLRDLGKVLVVWFRSFLARRAVVRGI